MINHLCDPEAIKGYYKIVQPVIDANIKLQREINADLYSRLNGVYDYTMIDHTPEYEPATNCFGIYTKWVEYGTTRHHP